MNRKPIVTRMRVFYFATFAATLFISGCSGCSFPQCDNDEDCGENVGHPEVPFCVDGTCRECRDDSACERGEECRNGTCSAISGYCDETDTCPAGQWCNNNRCTPGCDDPDYPCAAGEFCVDHDCVECRNNDDCDSGETCENGRCVVPPTACGNREFSAVYFDFDESAIRRDQEDRLEHNYDCLEEFPNENIEIEGHCDERGTEAYNLALGNRRARAAKDYLERLGADEDRLSTISYGETRPAERGSNESAWRQNRRAEFIWD